MILSLDLFSGYGGIALGLRKYCKPIGYCEIDRYAQGILTSRISSGELPIAPIYTDITKLRGSVGSADIITGGFPCQDISVAGTGKGLAGERSGLFYEIIRLTKEIKPKYVFLENSPAIRTNGLQEVVEAFTSLGYDCRWTRISAANVGANHIRRRWYFLANSNCSRQMQNSSQSKKRNNNTKSFGTSENVSNTERNKSGIQQGWSQWSRWKETSDNMDSSWWNSEPDLGRVANGIAFGVDRIKALGNGVVPLQAKKAFEILMGLTDSSGVIIKGLEL